MYVDHPRRKHHFLLKTLLGLLLAVILFVIICCLIGQPKADAPDSSRLRKDGVSAIVLAGTDEEGYRTDTIMLLTVDDKNHTVSLLSIPRDTYISGYSVPKINSVSGAYGGGEAGMEALLDELDLLLGFRPDGYAMINFDLFADLVDIFGGVDFEVPMDMDYEDPSQDLYIHLKAGEQHLDGEQSVQVLRFRSGYAMADLERVNVQRDFLQAALDQWLNPTILLRGPVAAGKVWSRMTTDLSAGNCVWLVKALAGCDFAGLTTHTLPGTPQYISGGSYYVHDPAAAAELMDQYYSPYASDLD